MQNCTIDEHIEAKFWQDLESEKAKVDAIRAVRKMSKITGIEVVKCLGIIYNNQEMSFTNFLNDPRIVNPLKKQYYENSID